MAEFLKNKTGPNRIRSEHAVAEKAFDSLRDLPLLDTRPEHFLRVLESGGVSTNSYLRRFHNFAADPGWLPWPVMPKRQWPKVRYQEKRAVAQAKHERILSHDQRACCRVGVTGVSLYSCRYACAERAKTAGYPERFAQVAFGHNSKVVHRAYARKAQVRLPALEQYETASAPPRAEEPSDRGRRGSGPRHRRDRRMTAARPVTAPGSGRASIVGCAARSVLVANAPAQDARGLVPPVTVLGQSRDFHGAEILAGVGAGHGHRRKQPLVQHGNLEEMHQPMGMVR